MCVYICIYRYICKFYMYVYIYIHMYFFKELKNKCPPPIYICICPHNLPHHTPVEELRASCQPLAKRHVDRYGVKRSTGIKRKLKQSQPGPWYLYTSTYYVYSKKIYAHYGVSIQGFRLKFCSCDVYVCTCTYRCVCI